jgi:outer membrane protein assembly factor BamB
MTSFHKLVNVLGRGNIWLAGLLAWGFGLAAMQSAVASPGTWPTWRADAARSGAVAAGVPENLHLQWVREYPPPQDAWRADTTLQFAAAYHPVAAEGMLFVPSMIHDCVQALDAETGHVVWTAYAGGPVRFAPVYWQAKLYFASDDGNLYCVDAKTGKTLWNFCGAPRNRMIIGNDRLISTWPVRGGPVLKDGRIYVANGVWPFMGIFVYCLNADTGEVVWVNDGTLEDGASRDQRVMHRPYEATPGGYLTIAGDKLLLPAGRVWPSCYDLQNGKRVLYTFRLPIQALKAPGSSTGVIASGDLWFVACRYLRTWSSICDARRGGGELVGYINGFPAVDGNRVYATRARELCAYDFSGKTFTNTHHPGEFSVEGREPAEPFPPSWTTQGAKAQHDPIKIGSCLYYGAWLGSGKRGGVSQLSALRILLCQPTGGSTLRG